MTKYAPHTQTEAIARAKSWVGESKKKGWCQAWVVADIFGTGGVGDWDGDRAADAEDGWKKAVANGKVVKAASIKSLKDIPAGLAMYWSGGSSDNGHAAVSAGNGKIYSTDLPTTGKVGLVDATLPHTKWGLTFLGYVLVEGNGYTLTDPPKKPAPDPRPKAGAPWFKIATFNMKAPSLTTSGAHKWTARRQGQVASIASLHTDVLCVQEAGSGTDLSWLDSHLKPHGLKRVPKGGNWRHIYISDLPEIVASGSFELTPLYNKDTKEAAWAVLKIGSQRVLVTSFHLESDSAAAADPIRVKQATSLVTQGAATAKKYDVSPERIFHAGDSNSQGLVASAMKGHGFVSADVNAWKSTNTTFATINNWINKRKGGHEDYIFVPAKRPVLTWTQKVNAIISDHNALLAQIAAIA